MDLPEPLVYHRTAARPSIEMWIPVALDSEALVDFSGVGWTFEFKLGERGKPGVFTKTTGITGAAGAGGPIGGTPNVTIAFTAGELDTVPATQYLWQLRATNGGLPRIYDGEFVLLDVIT